MPVRTHCHPLIGSFFDTPYNTVPGYWWGGVRVPRACEASLAPNQSRHKRCPQTIWQAQAHAGTRTSENMAPQLLPAPPGCNWYMGIPAHFKGGNLIHMCTMKLAILYPASPPLSCVLFLALPQVCKPTIDLEPYNLFRSSPTLKCHSVLLSESAQGFDLDVWGSEGGQGCLILAGCSWQDFTRLSLLAAVFATASPRVGMIFSA